MEGPNGQQPKKDLDQAYRTAYLIAGFLRQTLSESEHDELDAWVAESDANMLLFEKLTDKDNIDQDLKEMKGYDTERAIERIKQRISFNLPGITLVKQNRRLWHYMVAASVLLVACIITLYFITSPKKLSTTLAQNQDLPPGGNKAILTLSDGSAVNLSDAKNGVVKNENGTTISKTDDGRLVYAVTGNTNTEIEYNTLSTPKGGEYMVVLPDGTRAWLNAASSLKYPVAFNNNERIVELTGEGYFEAAKDQSKHFKVRLKNDRMVEVTGTHFNIMAYDDEINIQTTLLEGSVTVISNNKTTNIQPGQQAVIQKNGAIELNKEVNTDEVVAWQNGLFKYKDQPIENIMRQVARWYDVDIVYEGKVTDHFNITGIPRNVTVSKLFNLLEMTGRVHFRIEDKKIIVKP